MELDEEVSVLPRYHLTAISPPGNGPNLLCVASFPWSNFSLTYFWGGRLVDDEEWYKTRKKYANFVAIGAEDGLRIIEWVPDKDEPYENLVHIPFKKSKNGGVSAVAWALRETHRANPLILFAFSRRLFVYDVREKQIIGWLRGHGERITAISVHPKWPHLCCTNSRDFTSRLYNLSLTPAQEPKNKKWPPYKSYKLSPAFGLQATEPEGDGIGRCVGVLMGERAGGHTAPVLSSAFHPNYSMIATCGVDHSVKIWPLPYSLDDTESKNPWTSLEKPLFSSSNVHNSSICSVEWISDDLLLTSSMPVMKRTALQPEDPLAANHVNDDNENDPEGPRNKWKYDVGPGSITLWKWLGLTRFFPYGQSEGIRRPRVTVNGVPQNRDRGCASDYSQSSSFHVVSTALLPMSAKVTLHQGPKVNPFAVTTIPDQPRLKLVELCDLQPPPTPLIPLEFEDDTGLASSVNRLDLNGEPSIKTVEKPDVSQQPWHFTMQLRGSYLQTRTKPYIYADSDEEMLAEGPAASEGEEVISVCVSADGETIFAVGNAGRMWTWERE